MNKLFRNNGQYSADTYDNLLCTCIILAADEKKVESMIGSKKRDGGAERVILMYNCSASLKEALFFALLSATESVSDCFASKPQLYTTRKIEQMKVSRATRRSYEPMTGSCSSCSCCAC